jgi:hypothetical protein
MSLPKFKEIQTTHSIAERKETQMLGQLSLNKQSLLNQFHSSHKLFLEVFIIQTLNTPASVPFQIFTIHFVLMIA